MGANSKTSMEAHLRKLLDQRYPKGWRVNAGYYEAKRGREWKRIGAVGGRLPGRPRTVRGDKVTIYMNAETRAFIERWGTTHADAEPNMALGVRRMKAKLEELGFTDPP